VICIYDAIVRPDAADNRLSLIISNVASNVMFITRDVVLAVTNFVRFSRFFIKINLRYSLYILKIFKTCVIIF